MKDRKPLNNYLQCKQLDVNNQIDVLYINFSIQFLRTYTVISLSIKSYTFRRISRNQKITCRHQVFLKKPTLHRFFMFYSTMTSYVPHSYIFIPISFLTVFSCYHINGHPLVKVNIMQNLGVHFVSRLMFVDHIQGISLSTTKSLEFILPMSALFKNLISLLKVLVFFFCAK